MQFKKASKENSKLRLAIFGPSGSGKTYSSLSIASGLSSSNKIAVIDTEYGSASKYADQFEFDVVNLEKATIENMVAMIIAARDYDVLIIDSMSHAWQELLQEVEILAKTKFRGNSWSAWSEGTPKQKTLVRAILTFPGHVIACMRTKTEWVTSKTSDGKTRPERVGLAPEQGKGIEYEFDMLMELNPDHFGSIIKDRSGKYQDKIIEKPGWELGMELRKWLGVVKETPKVTNQQVVKATDDLIDEINVSTTSINERWGKAAENSKTMEVI